MGTGGTRLEIGSFFLCLSLGIMETDRIACSVPILSLNRRKELERCLPLLLKMCDDVFLVDGGSTDGTVEYAQSIGVRVERQLSAIESGANTPIADFRRERLHSWKLCQHDWIVYFDSDEIPTEEFFSMIRHAAAGDSRLVHTAKKGFQLANGIVVRHSAFFVEVVRVFARSSGATLCDRKVHERFVLPEGVSFCHHPDTYVICPEPDPAAIWERCLRYLKIEEESFSPKLATWNQLLRWIVWFNLKSLVGQFIRVLAVQCRLMLRREPYLPWAYSAVFLRYRLYSIVVLTRAWRRVRKTLRYSTGS